MSRHSEWAIRAIRTIYALWQVDSDCVEWVGDSTAEAIFTYGYGFDWWPGDFRVSVRANGPHPELDGTVYRLSVRTDYLRDVDVTVPELPKKLRSLNKFAPSFAVCMHPASDLHRTGELGVTDPALDSELAKVWLASTAYLDEATKDWLPRSFGRLALLQPIEAQSRTVSSWLGGTADHSAPARKARDEVDDILFMESLIANRGEQESEWIGTGEFQEIIDRWGNTANTIGRANEQGLFVETPFGSHTALAQLSANVPHPRLGNGLLATLVVPIFSDLESAERFCISLNYAEDRIWTKAGCPLLGNWTAEQTEDRHGAGARFAPTFGCFIPNSMYQRDLAEHLLVHLLVRAGWVQHTWTPDMANESLNAIFARRLNTQR